jgi:hypothetical protein
VNTWCRPKTAQYKSKRKVLCELRLYQFCNVDSSNSSVDRTGCKVLLETWFLSRRVRRGVRHAEKGRHPSTDAIVTFRKVSSPVFVYMKGSAVEIQAPKQLNQIGRDMTALPPVLSPSSILLSHGLMPLSFPRGKIRRASKHFFFLFKNCLCWDVSVLGSTAVLYR